MTSVLSCVDVSRTFVGKSIAPVKAVEHVTLQVESGQFVAIQGPSGSGKTTLMAIMCGIEPPDAGTVNLLGHELARLTVAERARLRRLKVGMVFQSFGLVHALSVGENVALPLALDGVSPAARVERAHAALASVGLDDVADKRIDELSGGQRQRVGVARAIVSGPEIVLADEPTGSLDDETATSILTLLRERTAALGAGLVLVTHDPLSAAAADRHYQMRDGHLTEAGQA